MSRGRGGYARQQRQISEPVGRNYMSDRNFSAAQSDIEALNRALRDFQHNFTISPRVFFTL
ncbi:uncharacterized protein BXIN_1704 [Babesia sp. Xinjiang]|uniref:uncharacterized protein n=1 Tax=Babesia sp. Xinjiang TaxID=462227 RepID=UPI000A256A16|nr:uncharacterized protein BXIN_1704 [Babesia sp. Xinjiang]ORM40912.1 hypothetical protein BXIN_1704 [Babesia sp. Xinjiang]